MFNAPAPAIVKHHISVGGGYDITRNVGLHAAYYHAFRNSITGPFQTPAGPAPGTTVTNSLQEDSFVLQFTLVPVSRH
jgi:long-chain fatty acid transport protein